MTLKKSSQFETCKDRERINLLAEVESKNPEETYIDCRRSALGESPKSAYPLSEFIELRAELEKRGPKR